MDTPWKITSHDAIHKQASYFIFEFDAPSSSLDQFNNYLSRDIDIIKRTIFKVPENIPQPACTLHDELKPPAYRWLGYLFYYYWTALCNIIFLFAFARSEVKEMIAIGKRKREKEARKKVQFNTGLDYMPFQR